MMHAILGLYCSGILVLSTCCVVGFAQPEVRGTTSGILFDHNCRCIRPIVGIIGSAYLGPALLSEIDDAHLSPNGRYALISRDGHWTFARDVDTGSPANTELPELSGEPVSVAWSADSTFVAWADRNGHVLLYRREDLSLVSAADIALPTGQLVSLAVTRGGKLVAGLQAEDSSGYYLVGDGDGQRLLVNAAIPGATAFSANENDLYLTDSINHRVLRLIGFRNGGTADEVATERDGIAKPTGLAFRRGILFIADSDPARIVAVDTSGEKPLETLSLEVEPEGLSLIPGGTAYLIGVNQSVSGPYFVLLPDRRTIQFLPDSQGN